MRNPHKCNHEPGPILEKEIVVDGPYRGGEAYIICETVCRKCGVGLSAAPCIGPGDWILLDETLEEGSTL